MHVRKEPTSPATSSPIFACEDTCRSLAALRLLEVRTLDCDRLSARRLDAKAPGGTHEGHHGPAEPVEICSTLEVLERDLRPEFKCKRRPLSDNIRLALSARRN